MLGIATVVGFRLMELYDWFSFALSGCRHSYAVKRRSACVAPYFESFDLS
jgi:hypothetical protein